MDYWGISACLITFLPFSLRLYQYEINYILTSHIHKFNLFLFNLLNFSFFHVINSTQESTFKQKCVFIAISDLAYLKIILSSNKTGIWGIFFSV